MRTLALFALLMALGFPSAAQSQQAPPNNQSEPPKAENQNSAVNSSPNAEKQQAGGHEENRCSNTFTCHPTEWLLVVFNGLLALYTWRLYRATDALVTAADQQSTDVKDAINAINRTAQATETANKLAEEAREISDRPWVGIEAIGWPFDLFSITQHHEVSKIEVTIKNWGKNPAFKVRGQFSGSIRGQNDDMPIAPAAAVNERYGHGALFPNGTARYWPFQNRPDLSAERYAEIEAQTSFMWVVGRVDYVDAANENHFTTVVFWWNPGTKTFMTHQVNTDERRSD
ncbi:MAG TPA: hypothetical protein VMU06_23065 [Stellaceae bacterium]|nr:hypothetical protein [Stellaceae bacterium]